MAVSVVFKIKALKTSLSFKFLYHEPYKNGDLELLW